MSAATTELSHLAILGIPVATVTWTVTHEEIFREFREWCVQRSKRCSRLYQRKLLYLLTCEYCFSHYIAACFLILVPFPLLLNDWRGYFLSWLALVWVANVYMSLYGRLRLDIHHERLRIEAKEETKEEEAAQPDGKPMARSVAPKA